MEISTSKLDETDYISMGLNAMKVAPKLTKLEVVMNKEGTVALKTIFSRLAILVKRAYVTFADGFQLTDVSFIPASVGDVLVIAKNVPQSILEAKDLSIEEIGEIIAHFISEVLVVYSELKNKPVSTN